MPEQRIAENLPQWIKDHLQSYIETDGEVGHYWDAAQAGGEGMLPTLLLTTEGRKSGHSLTLPLIYSKTGNGYCIIASKGGAPAHPAWFHNLSANTEVHLQVAADKFDAVARVAEGDERTALWDQMVAIYPPYTDYQAATDRTIPVVVVEAK